jgi:hypothetical protein
MTQEQKRMSEDDRASVQAWVEGLSDEELQQAKEVLLALDKENLHFIKPDAKALIVQACQASQKQEIKEISPADRATILGWFEGLSEEERIEIMAELIRQGYDIPAAETGDKAQQEPSQMTKDERAEVLAWLRGLDDEAFELVGEWLNKKGTANNSTALEADNAKALQPSAEQEQTA